MTFGINLHIQCLHWSCDNLWVGERGEGWKKKAMIVCVWDAMSKRQTKVCVVMN